MMEARPLSAPPEGSPEVFDMAEEVRLPLLSVPSQWLQNSTPSSGEGRLRRNASVTSEAARFDSPDKGDGSSHSSALDRGSDNKLSVIDCDKCTRFTLAGAGGGITGLDSESESPAIVARPVQDTALSIQHAGAHQLNIGFARPTVRCRRGYWREQVGLASGRAAAPQGRHRRARGQAGAWPSCVQHGSLLCSASLGPATPRWRACER